MIKLNLIAPTYKKMVKQDKLLYSAKIVLLYVALLAIISSIALITARTILDNSFIKAVNQDFISEIQKDNKQIFQINNKINSIKKIQQDYIAWSRLIIRLSEIIPNNIIINSINILPEKNNMKWNMNIKGIASDRSALLTLKKDLSKNEDLFKNVEIPLTFKKENINFDINVEVEKDILTSLKLEYNR